MLPGNLVSKYKEYKEDTNAVASWLASTARSCGYPSDLLCGDSSKATGPERSKRLKGKARKEAKAASLQSQGSSSSSSRPDYIIAIKDFVPLAEFVAASKKPVISVPLAFANTLNRVIATRSHVSSRLAELGNTTDASADSKHSYFMGVLEKVREVLKPRVPPAFQDAARSRPPSDPVGEVGGRFAGLSVHEPSEEFLNAPDIERPTPVKNDRATYAIEPQKEFNEVMFAYNLLMNDLTVIRTRIEWIWGTYQDNGFDPVAAAIATNTACDLARNLMEDITPMLKAHGGAVEVGSKFYVYQCVIRGFSFKDVTNSGKEFHYDTYEIGNGTFMIAYTMLESILSGLGIPDGLPLFNYDDSGTYDPTLDWSRMTMQEKFEQDKILMTETFTDLMALIRCVPDYPVHDEFIRGFQEFDRTKEIPMYLAFAAQIFLDIHHILRGQVYSAYETCMSQMRLMDEDLGLHLDFHAKLFAKKSTASQDDTMKKLQEEIKWVQGDPVHQAMVRAFGTTGEHYTGPRHRILRYSPVISGLMLYHYRATIYLLGLQMVDRWGSIVYPLHLYNALQQQEVLSPLQSTSEFWADMASVESILGRESFYVGSELPQNPEDYLKKLGLQIGITATAFTKSKHFRNLTRNSLTTKSGPRLIKRDCAPVSDMFIDRYVRNTGQVEWTPEHVDRVISRSLHEVVDLGHEGKFGMRQITDPDRLRERKRNIVAEAAGKRAATGARMAPDELIKALFYALEAEAMAMVFPYLELHRATWGILHAVRDACEPSLLESFDPSHFKDEGQLPQVVALILMALALGDDRPFVKAGQVVKDQLRRGEGIRAMKRLRAMGFDVVEQLQGVGVSPP